MRPSCRWIESSGYHIKTVEREILIVPKNAAIEKQETLYLFSRGVE